MVTVKNKHGELRMLSVQFTVGYQESEIDNPGATGATYDNDAYGISFAVNDDLSISYGNHESKT